MDTNLIYGDSENIGPKKTTIIKEEISLGKWKNDLSNWDNQDINWDDVQEIKYVKETRSTLYTAGEYVILANSSPYIGVEKITGVTEKFQDTGKGTIVKKEFRYSVDSVTFSEFQEITEENLSTLGSFKYVWFQFRYILLTGGPITYTGVDLVYDKVAEDIYAQLVPPNKKDESRVYAYPITYKSNFLWNPYKLNRAIRLYKDLNLMVNNLFGHQTNYYRALPQGRSKDVFLMEWSLYEHEDLQCVKVVVPDNQFPDNKLYMGPHGVDFEMPFEVHIDKDYFQTIFGEGTGPQKRDVIHFPITNRIYEVSSSYLFRDFMNTPLYFKVTLIKWLPKSNVEQSDSLNSLEDLTRSAGELFGEIMGDDMLNKSKPDQYNVAYASNDPVREYIAPNLKISDINLLNYHTVVAKHCYELGHYFDSFIRADVDTTDLEKNRTYYVRVSPESSQPDTQYYYSIKTAKYLGTDDDGFAVFNFGPGAIYNQVNYYASRVFYEGSPYNLYEDEYAGETVDESIVSCDTSPGELFNESVVRYKLEAQFGEKSDRSFSAWFNLTANPNSSISISTYNFDIYQREMEVTMQKKFMYVPGDKVIINRISGGEFFLFGKVTEIVNDTTIKIQFDQEILDYVRIYGNWQTYTDLQVQKTYSRIFFSSRSGGKGIQIELIENRHFKIMSNDKNYYFSIPNNTSGLDLNKWYAVFINFSNLFKQLTLNVWKIQWDSATNMPATTDLKIVLNKTVSIEREDRTAATNFQIKPSYMNLTNIRWFNKVAETDKQVFILNQNIVKDSQWALITDNALPQDHRPYISYTR